MARPTKQETDRRDSRLYIRCKDEQKARIKARAEKVNLDMSSFVVEMSLNGEVIVNDNAVSFPELSLIHQLRTVGLWLNKSFTHRANISGDLPTELHSCLRAVDQVLTYTDFFIRYHDDHVVALKEADEQSDRERSYPAALSIKTVFQLNGLRNNLKQLSRIGALRDLHPRELGECLNKVEGLLKRIT